MEFIKTPLSGAYIIKPQIFRDNRGFFLESYSKREFEKHGIDIDFVQDNHSLSVKKGVLRGLHYQAPPHAQTKLMRVTRGSVFDVMVDIRKDSPTYGQWEAVELSADNFSIALIPQGFLHGFVTLEDNTEFQYKCDNFYEPSSEGGVVWNDPTLGIEWPVTDPVLSDRDQKWGEFKDFQSPF